MTRESERQSSTESDRTQNNLKNDKLNFLTFRNRTSYADDVATTLRRYEIKLEICKILTFKMHAQRLTLIPFTLKLMLCLGR